MRKESFLEELKRLEAQFDGLSPEVELTVRDPELGVEGFVVVWTTLAAFGGPLGRIGKGGTRITPTLTLDEVKILARTMALKNAAAGLPLGGAKSGIRADPSAPDFERKYRRFVSLVRPILAENGGSFGGFGFDIGGNPIQATWACDELKSTRSFTGKPVELGGTDYDREGIAGLGVVIAADTALKVSGANLQKQKIAIQGLGAMGAAIFRYVLELGGTIAVISDPRIGGTFHLSNNVAEKIKDSVVKGDLTRVREQLAGENCGPLDEVLFTDVDCLFPAALQGVIKDDNVQRLKARYVFEAANNPCTDEAREMLYQRGILLIPDFIANPGGIIAAFVELSSKISPEENVRTRKNVNDAKEMTKTRIAENVRKVLSIANEFNVSPIQAGKFVALKNIFKDRGLKGEEQKQRIP